MTPGRASAAPSTRRRSAWRWSISTASGGRSTGRSARCCATRRRSCWSRRARELTHPDDLADDLAQVAGFVSGSSTTATSRSASSTAAATSCGRSSRARSSATPRVGRSTSSPRSRTSSERRQFEAKLSHLADHDSLSGLFNRRRFEHELARQLAYTERYGDPGHGADARPRQLQVRQRHARARHGRRAAGPRLHGAASIGCARRTSSPASAATSSRSSCPRPTRRRPSASPGDLLETIRHDGVVLRRRAARSR